MEMNSFKFKDPAWFKSNTYPHIEYDEAEWGFTTVYISV